MNDFMDDVEKATDRGIRRWAMRWANRKGTFWRVVMIAAGFCICLYVAFLYGQASVGG